MKRRLFLPLILSGLLLCGTVSAQKKDAVIENQLIEAVSRYDSGNFESAKKLLTAILPAAPQNDAVHYYLGLCDIALQDYEEAETFLAKAVELDPDNYWYQDRLAYLYAGVGQFDRSIAIYEGMLEKFPGKQEPYYTLLSLYAQQNRVDKVSETLQKISDYSGESAQILAMQGDAMMSSYEDSLALNFYERALELEPSYPPALLGKAEALRLSRRYDDYFDVLEKYLASESVAPVMKADYLQNIYTNMDGRFYQNFRGRLDEIADNMGAMYPSDSTILLCIGSYYYSTGRLEEAKETIGRNRELYPDSYSAAVMYSQLLSYIGEWEEMALECERAYSDFPQEPGFIESKVLAYYYMEDYRSAIVENERLLKLYGKDSDRLLSAYSTAGDLYHQVGDSKKSYAAYEKALKINPDYAPVLNNYAYYLCLEGKKLSKAYRMSKKTIEQEPDNSTYLDTFGWILFRQGKALEAKPFFKHAMIYGGKESAECLNHYAQVLEKLGENDLATYYRSLAEQKTD